jgi:hypothetical protein
VVTTRTSLELEHEVVDGRAAVDLEQLDPLPRVSLNRLQHIRNLRLGTACG